MFILKLKINFNLFKILQINKHLSQTIMLNDFSGPKNHFI